MVIAILRMKSLRFKEFRVISPKDEQQFIGEQ